MMALWLSDPWYYTVLCENLTLAMWTCGLVFSVCIFVVLASEIESFDRNGWIPVDSDIIYNQIKNGFSQATRYTKVNYVQSLNTDELSTGLQHHKHIKDVTEETVDNNGDSTTDVRDIFQYEPNSKYDNDLPLNNFPNVADQKVQSDTSVRRSKKLAGIGPTMFFNNELLSKYETTEYNNVLKREDILEVNDKNSEGNTYEVTEITNIDEKQEGSELKENGYEYKPPGNQNFTNNLIKIVSKYDSKDIDNLQNYALSRRLRAKTPVRPDHFKSLRFQVPIRYNSLDHLSVDPLLAVFLSNYGYYLQGRYGISNNYKNWYGYLASNNIHNNRPFGSYKLYSDTDSSN